MAIDLGAPDIRRNPYPLYQRLRREDPVTFVEETYYGPTWLVTRYEDIVALLNDPRFSSDRRNLADDGDRLNQWWMPKIFRALMDSMVLVDDPDHFRLRNLVHKAFTPRMIRRLEPRIEAISHELLDAVANQEVVDLIAAFALPLPLTVISEMMGVPEEDRLKFHKWSASFLDLSFDKPLELLPQLPNAFQMNRFFKQLIRMRQRQPADDLITALVQAEEAGDRLSEDELVAMLFLLLLAGHETTVNLIGNGTLALLENPTQLAKLRERPELMDCAVEELLRFTNPVESLAPRYALEDVELGGHHIARGETLLLAIASANRDEAKFEQPQELDIERHPNKHVAFGLGIHYCLGAPLARLEGQVAFKVLLDRCPHLALAVPSEKLEWRRSATVRGLKALPVRLH
ncbi:MAG: cytochrome P450 [Chloroflexota bacterium]